MIIKVSKFLDDRPVELFQEIESNISKGLKVTLDFYSIKSLQYDFLEKTLGKLLNDRSFESIGYQLRFINVDVGIREMLSKIVNDHT